MTAFKGWKAKLILFTGVIGFAGCGLPVFHDSIAFSIGTANAAYPKRLTSRQKILITRYIEEAAAKHHLEPALLRAIIRVESAYNYEAVSHAGARGLMQIMPHTAKALDAEKALDSSKPKYNIMAGAKLLRTLINRYSGKIKLALAAYNAGPTAVAKYNGIPPFKETRNYVKKVLYHLDRERSRSLNRSH